MSMEGARPPSARALTLRFGPLFLLLAVGVLAYASGVLDHVNLDELGQRREWLKGQVAAAPLASALVFLAAVAGGVSLCLPVVLALSLIGGLLFGVLEGGLLTAAGSTLGGMVVYAVCRTAAGDWLGRIAGPRIARMQAGAQRNPFALVLTLRLIPGMPFWLINIGAALVRIPLGAFAAATALGVIPSSLIYASLGAGLGRMFEAGVRPTMAALLQPHLLAPLFALALLAGVPVAWRQWRRRRASLPKAAP